LLVYMNIFSNCSLQELLCLECGWFIIRRATASQSLYFHEPLTQLSTINRSIYAKLFELDNRVAEWSGAGCRVDPSAVTSVGAPSVCFVYRTTTPASSSILHCTFHGRAIPPDLLRAELACCFDPGSVDLRNIFSALPIHVSTTRHDLQQRCRRGIHSTRCNPPLPTALGKHALFANSPVA
jgi:hypothetical protein